MMDDADAIANAPLCATLFGDFRLTWPGWEEIVISGKRAQSLLAIRCLDPGVAVARDRLCGLLWRGRFRAQARASLRQTLLGLKQRLTPIRPDLFAITRDRVAINATAIRSDLAGLESALAATRIARSEWWNRVAPALPGAG
jgi:DNA-binding SARP family transcriptional activator